MHAFGTIATANMMYTKSQNHTNMVVGKHGIQILKVVVVVMLLLMLSIDGFCPYKCTSRINFGQVVCVWPMPFYEIKSPQAPSKLI
jgi:hypothetical protein